ncbi:MAG: Asp23/Gls24 family envelope stress response protein [Clostridia bacterium]|nr:Asp23/Gls24 family envelope stress response protein [Clostridia bacterium]
MKVFAFVGPSGTGKSYRAQMVASEKGINYIIDDGLLICGNEVIAGVSAKQAATKIETVKNALFQKTEKQHEIQKAIKKHKPDSILILGTSDGMVEKIAKNLGFPEISETIYIQDVATEEEMKTARNIRVTEGKHVIPVPTFAIKKDFSGFLLDPLQIFKSKGKGKEPYISEKSIIRPTFSYIGNFQISDNVFKQIIEYIAEGMPEIYKIHRIIIKKNPEYNGGIYIYIETIVEFGYNILDTMTKFKSKIKKQIENLTAMNVLNMDIIVKSVNYKG